MSFALRERRWLLRPFAVWALVSAVAAIAGPFGTLAALPPLPRLLYWGAVAAISVSGSYVVGHVTAGQGRRRKIALMAAFVVVISSAVNLLNLLLFPDWRFWSGQLYLTVIVGAVVVAVYAALWLMRGAVPDKAAAEADTTATAFQRRLPFETRGPLIRIEAQDHYLNVVTGKGSALVLMRLGDAVQELAEVQGLQVHRSHWVALAGIKGHRRVQGRDLLDMADGRRVPVSRSYREAARTAGVF